MERYNNFLKTLIEGRPAKGLRTTREGKITPNRRYRWTSRWLAANQEQDRLSEEK